MEKASSRRGDPLKAARERGVHAGRRLLCAEGDALTARQVAERLHLSPGAVSGRRRAGTLLALEGNDSYLYPSWQFVEDGMLRGVDDVLLDLKDHDPWMQLAFFLTGDLRLHGETPLAELRRGHVAAVRRAARAYGEQGAA